MATSIVLGMGFSPKFLSLSIRNYSNEKSTIIRFLFHFFAISFILILFCFCAYNIFTINFGGITRLLFLCAIFEGIINLCTNEILVPLNQGKSEFSEILRMQLAITFSLGPIRLCLFFLGNDSVKFWCLASLFARILILSFHFLKYILCLSSHVSRKNLGPRIFLIDSNAIYGLFPIGIWMISNYDKFLASNFLDSKSVSEYLIVFQFAVTIGTVLEQIAFLSLGEIPDYRVERMKFLSFIRIQRHFMRNIVALSMILVILVSPLFVGKAVVKHILAFSFLTLGAFIWGLLKIWYNVHAVKDGLQKYMAIFPLPAICVEILLGNLLLDKNASLTSISIITALGWITTLISCDFVTNGLLPNSPKIITYQSFVDVAFLLFIGISIWIVSEFIAIAPILCSLLILFGILTNVSRRRYEEFIAK